MDFNSEVGSMTEEALNGLFEDAAEGTTPGTPSAEDLALGKVQVGAQGELEPLKTEEVKDLFDDDTKTPEEIEAAKKVADDKIKADADAKALKDKEDADKAKTKEQLAEEKKVAKEAEIAAAKEKADKEKLDAEASSPEVIEALTNTVDFLVKSGQWVDFEGREGLEITPEIYQEIVINQDKIRLNAQFDELVDSTGDYGKAIIAHVKNGGNPDDVIDIFKEQKALEAIKTDTEAGKQVLIEKYYKDIMGWKDEKVQKHIKRLITDDEVNSEFTDVKELYDNHYKQQLESLDKEAKAQQQLAQQRKEEFKTSIKTALEKENTLTPKERKEVEDAILNFKHDVGGGQRVNDFYIRFAEMQKDPSQYIELVRFVMNPKNYKKTIAQVAESTEAVKAFKFIKGNAAVKKPGTVTPKNSSTQTNTQGGTNFSFTPR